MQLQVKCLVNGSLHQHMHVEIFSVTVKIFFGLLAIQNSTWYPDMISEELIVKILPMHHMSYHIVVCNRAVNFAPYFEGADSGEEHK